MAHVYKERPWLKFYPEGVPADVTPGVKSVPQQFDEVAEKFANQTAIIFYGKKIKYHELREDIDRFAAALSDIGIQHGDKVGIYLPNCPQFVIAYFGVLKAGATVTPISPVYISREVAYQLSDSEATSIVCLDTLFDNVERAGADLRHVIITNIGEYLPASKKFLGKVFGKVHRKMELPTPKIAGRGIYRFQDILKNYPVNPPTIEFDPMKDIATLPYTGGTTGVPKGAIITHYNIISMSKQVNSYTPIIEDGKEVIVGFLPFYHIYGQVVVLLGSLLYGQTILLFTTPDVDDILSAIEKYGATVFNGVPTMFEYLIDYDKTPRVNWKRFKLITCGADTLHESTAKRWEMLTEVKITEGYGLTETTSVSHINPIGRGKMGSFGIPLPNTVAALAHPEKNELLPPEEIGEVVIKGPQIMQGYWKKPKETAQTLVEIDGEIWMRTGDIARVDEEFYFYFIDRKKDLIKYKGYSVFARDIEEVLYEHPKIKEAGVIGVPDPKFGQIVKAVIVLESESRGKLSEEDIINFCKEHLAHYKVPKIVEFRGEIPKTDVGKVSHRELRDEWD
ncbi:MAG: long-chain fatty acid--CoA ligase [Candidatus Heimdallarchaeota archaeon]